ncbi:hypothetical protein AGMMS50293_03250 [Spirochaetia bacterium]|nr:hypothetical protein AGMMS50293_03250 [Spirochaetia bacterium]
MGFQFGPTVEKGAGQHFAAGTLSVEYAVVPGHQMFMYGPALGAEKIRDDAPFFTVRTAGAYGVDGQYKAVNESQYAKQDTKNNDKRK